MSALQPGRIEPQATVERRAGHQSSDIPIPAVIAFLIFMGFSAFVMHAGLWGWLKELRGKVGVDAAEQFEYRASSRTASQFPTLQIKPEIDWNQYHKEQQALLNGYGWVDKTAGVVRVPISVAIDRLLKDGVPHWGPTNRSVSPLELQRSRAEGGGK